MSVPEAAMGGPVVFNETGAPAMHRVGGASVREGEVYQGVESTAMEYVPSVDTCQSRERDRASVGRKERKDNIQSKWG